MMHLSSKFWSFVLFSKYLKILKIHFHITSKLTLADGSNKSQITQLSSRKLLKTQYPAFQQFNTKRSHFWMYVNRKLLKLGALARGKLSKLYLCVSLDRLLYFFIELSTEWKSYFISDILLEIACEIPLQICNSYRLTKTKYWSEPLILYILLHVTD